MAILDALPGVSVEIEIDGQITPEFDDPDSAEPLGQELPSQSSYIESTSGARFAIVGKIPGWFPIPPTKLAYLSVTIDGTKFGLWFFGQIIGQEQSLVINSVLSSSTEAGFVYRHELTFAAATTTDDHEVSRTAVQDRSLEKLGTIEVGIGHVKRESLQEVRYPQWKSLQGRERGVPEKAVKGKNLSHNTSFASKQASSQEKSYYKYSEHTVLGRFIFMYRSRKALENLMAVSREISPALGAVSALSGRSDSEVRRLAEQILEIKQEVKQEHSEPAVRVKRLREDNDGDDDDGEVLCTGSQQREKPEPIYVDLT